MRAALLCADTAVPMPILRQKLAKAEAPAYDREQHMTESGRDERILVVDGDEAVRRLVTHELERAGHTCLSASGPSEARELLAKEQISLVLWDLEMCEGSGHELIREILSEQTDVASLIVGPSDAPPSAVAASAFEAYGYLVKPLCVSQLLVAVSSALRRQRVENENRAYRETNKEVIHRLSVAGEFRDEATGVHVERMGRIACLLAQRLGLDVNHCELIRIAAPLHDIGKVGIPDSILRKPGPLTEDERAVMQEHTSLGHLILSGSDTALLDMAATIAWTHQEKYDGSGYPLGLAGEEIPIEGRLAAVADVFDTLIHDRVYRPALPLGEAIEILRRGSGSHFDPAVIEAFFDALPEIAEIVDGGAEMSGDGVKVLIVEDHAGIRKGIELLLRNEGYLVVGSADDAEQGYPLIQRRAPDVAIIDVRLPGESGIELTRRLLNEPGAPRVLLYTGVEDEKSLEDAVDAGAAGIACKAGPLSELVTAIGDVARGGTYFDPRLGSLLARSNPDAESVLTSREKEILELLARGLSGEQIAADLCLSPETVRTHVRNAMSKLSVRTRVHAVTEALRRHEIAL